MQNLTRDNFLKLIQDLEKEYPFFLAPHIAHSTQELIMGVRKTLNDAISSKQTLEELRAKLEHLLKISY